MKVAESIGRRVRRREMINIGRAEGRERGIAHSIKRCSL
jgi:hypothetical protein